MSSDNNVYIVADTVGDNGNSSGNEDLLGGLNGCNVMPTAAKIASAFATFHYCCGAMGDLNLCI